MPLGMKYDADPFDGSVEAQFHAYECGATEYAPVGEEHKIPERCGACGAPLK
jgi:hypothetical protein